MCFAGGPASAARGSFVARFCEPADRAQVPLAPAPGRPQAPGTVRGKSDLMLLITSLKQPTETAWRETARVLGFGEQVALPRQAGCSRLASRGCVSFSG